MKYTHKDEDHNYFVDDMAMQPADFNQANYNNNVLKMCSSNTIPSYISIYVHIP